MPDCVLAPRALLPAFLYHFLRTWCQEKCVVLLVFSAGGGNFSKKKESYAGRRGNPRWIVKGRRQPLGSKITFSTFHPLSPTNQIEEWEKKSRGRSPFYFNRKFMWIRPIHKFQLELTFSFFPSLLSLHSRPAILGREASFSGKVSCWENEEKFVSLIRETSCFLCFSLFMGPSNL